jgi:hypothetical protein
LIQIKNDCGDMYYRTRWLAILASGIGGARE